MFNVHVHASGSKIYLPSHSCKQSANEVCSAKTTTFTDAYHLCSPAGRGWGSKKYSQFTNPSNTQTHTQLTHNCISMCFCTLKQEQKKSCKLQASPHHVLQHNVGSRSKSTRRLFILYLCPSIPLSYFTTLDLLRILNRKHDASYKLYTMS
jgi:hypothetical protein